MMTYTNHSGGCPGADMTWETEGYKYGVKSIGYSFLGHTQYSKNSQVLTSAELDEGAEHAKIASFTLKRPWDYLADKRYVRNLISRNWFQVKNSECVFPIGTFVKESRKLVNGGTGWAVQMAIDNNKPICFYEQNEGAWYKFFYDKDIFCQCPCIPHLTENFAGIGTREINKNGINAIKIIYENTFQP